MKERPEMRRVLVFLMLVVLVSQPLLVLNGSASLGGTISEYAVAIAEPERGCRYSGSELTDHVPILIDETADFASQGWPGAGNQLDPYVISRLNITYDVGLTGIRVVDTDAYFVIRDCFIKQVSGLVCIELFNASHASIEYTTAISPSGPLTCGYTNNLRIVRCETYAGIDMALTLYHSNGTLLQWNSFSSTSMRGLYAEWCWDLQSAYNEYVAMSTSWNCVYLYSCDRASSLKDHSSQGYVGFYVSSSDDVVISGFEGEDNQVGISLADTPRVEVSDCIVTDAADIGIEIDSCPDAVVDNSIVVDCGSLTTDYAIYIFASNDSRVTDTQIIGAGGRGIYVAASHRVTLDQNEISETGADGLSLYECPFLTVTDNVIAAAASRGITAEGSNNTLAKGNTVTETGGWGIHFMKCDDLELEANDVSSCYEIGIGVLSSDRPRVEDNVVTHTGYGIIVSGCENATVIENTVSMTEVGIRLYGSLRAFAEENMVSECTTGIQVYMDNYPTLNGNLVQDCQVGVSLDSSIDVTLSHTTVIDCIEIGVYVRYTHYLTATDNTLTDCGFLFEYFGTASYYNLTMTGNTVNDRPVYYGKSQEDITLNGNLYGQMIFFDCRNVDVTGGTFHNVAPCQAFYSELLRFEGISSYDSTTSFVVDHCENVTFSDINIEGGGAGYAIILYAAPNVTISDLTASNLVEEAIRNGLTHNLVVKSSSFTNVKYGIRGFGGSFNVNVSDSGFSNIEVAGIIPYMSSTNWTVSNCHFVNCTWGAYFWQTTNARVEDTFFEHCGSGVGVEASTSDNGWIVRSQFLSNEYGVHVTDGDFWHILNSTFLWNTEYGVWLSGCTTPEIHGNTFGLSGTANGYSNLVQYWDDGISQGNSWDDYLAPPPYDISGAGATDRYPSLFLPTEPIIDSPLDVYYAEFSTGNYLEWTPYDDYLRDWTVELDGATLAAGSWYFDKITVGIDGLSYGTHTVVVTVSDIDDNSIIDEVLVHVYDGTAPTISKLANTEAFVGATGQSLVWQASDLHPSSYSVLRDGEEIESEPWTGGAVSASLDGLSLGYYDFTMIVYDIDGNSASDTVSVLVISDTTDPTVDSPLDMVFVVRSTGNQIIWTPSDDHPENYEVVENDTVVSSGAWTGGRIILSLDALPVGRYDFTLTVRDGAGHNASDTVNVRVVPYEGYVEPPFFDLVLLLVVGGALAGVVVVVVVLFHIRRRKSTY